MLLPNTNSYGARVIAETIRAAVAGLQLATAAAPKVTVSIGLETLNPAAYPCGAEELLKRADQALYCAKHQGRNLVRQFAEDAGSLSHPAIA